LVLFCVLQVQAIAALLLLAFRALWMTPQIALRGVRAVLGAPRRHAPERTSRKAHDAEQAASADLTDLARPNDVLIVLGSPWFSNDYAAIVDRLRRQSGIRFAVLVHDIVPLRRPEWCDRTLVRLFRNWYGSVLPVSDAVFSVSHATAADLERHAAAAGIRLEGRVKPIPMGTGFGNGAAGEEPETDDASLPAPGEYILFVSTIEARKNHALLFRVWRRMVDELPPEKVPILVFAGRVGWLVSDLMQQLENARFLDGKIRIVRAPTDATLRRLYRGCLFTLFPSLFEGWGLPVTESLALGKPCIASNRTAIPEAGGALARYFDPENLADAYNVIRAAIEDRAGLSAWQEQVVREFRPVSWDETATAIVQRLDELPAGFVAAGQRVAT
jgi:glycosyltransferase involved in cell wall biosynthesis